MYCLHIKRFKECKDVIKPGYLFTEDSTISTVELYDRDVDGRTLWKGFACENIGPSTDQSGTDKRIVAREYKLKWRASGKNGAVAKRYPQWKLDGRNTAIHVVTDEVPGFNDRLILIHSGNYPQDSLGCILVGLSEVGGAVSNSVEAIHQLFTKIKEVGIENVVLLVEEIN